MKNKPKIGISSCLLGKSVRYNGGNKKDSWVISELSKFVDFYPVCPEVEMGLGTPREEIRLSYNEKTGERGLITKKSEVDLTKQASKTYKRLNKEIKEAELDGFILMKKSPSCALSQTKAVNFKEKGPGKFIEGLFAYNLVNQFPEMPKLDSGRLFNKKMREKFIKKVYAHFRFSKLNPSTKDLQGFHKRYKYIFMEHSAFNLAHLGEIAANSGRIEIETVMESYKQLMMETLSIEADPGKRFNVLQHLFGYVKNHLNTDERKRVLTIFEDFKEGISQYMISVEVINLMVHKYSVEYLTDHYYFNPYPKRLKIHGDI